ncbi:MAG: hypothetical protein J6B22_07610 [Clostridia bacterium]|nr:hypothetical protein [Clostridia bacterium]
MTGTEIFNRVCFLLGYYDFLKDNDQTKKLALIQIINQIADDLNLSKIASLSDSLTLTSKQAEALIYGVCMLFALSLKDSNTAKVYSSLYSVKRSTALNIQAKREDVLPYPLDGGV